MLLGNFGMDGHGPRVAGMDGLSHGSGAVFAKNGSEFTQNGAVKGKNGAGFLATDKHGKDGSEFGIFIRAHPCNLWPISALSRCGPVQEIYRRVTMSDVRSGANGFIDESLRNLNCLKKRFAECEIRRDRGRKHAARAVGSGRVVPIAF